MKVSEARTQALQLLAAADTAEAAGKEAIDSKTLIQSLQQVASSAREDLAKAIAESMAKPIAKKKK